MKNEVWVGGAVNYSYTGRIDEKTKRPKSKDLGWRKRRDQMHLFRAYSPVMLGNVMLQFG